MARARNIKPGFFTNEQLAECSFAARLLFVGLWTLADREGRLEDRPRRIRAQVFPYDEVDVDALLDELAAADFIKRYSSGSTNVVWVTGFVKNQNPHHSEKDSELPAFDAACLEKSGALRKVPDKDGTNPADSLFSDSLLLKPESLCTEEISGACADVPKDWKKPSVFLGVTEGLLRDAVALNDWHTAAAQLPRPVTTASDRDRLFVFAAAARALDRSCPKPAENPAALFAWIVSGNHRTRPTEAHYEAARQRLKALDEVARYGDRLPRAGPPVDPEAEFQRKRATELKSLTEGALQ